MSAIYEHVPSIADIRNNSVKRANTRYGKKSIAIPISAILGGSLSLGADFLASVLSLQYLSLRLYPAGEPNTKFVEHHHRPPHEEIGYQIG